MIGESLFTGDIDCEIENCCVSALDHGVFSDCNWHDSGLIVHVVKLQMPHFSLMNPPNVLVAVAHHGWL